MILAAPAVRDRKGIFLPFFPKGKMARKFLYDPNLIFSPSIHIVLRHVLEDKFHK